MHTIEEIIKSLEGEIKNLDIRITIKIDKIQDLNERTSILEDEIMITAKDCSEIEKVRKEKIKDLKKLRKKLERLNRRPMFKKIAALI